MKIFKQIISVFLRIGVSIILLAFLFKQVDKQAMLEILKNANKFLLLSAFFIFFANYILALWRWEMLLKAIKIHLPQKRVIISFCGGAFFSLFLPSTIGGDLIRSIDLAVHTKRPKEVVATVFLDRLSGYIGLVAVTLLALLFGWRLIQDTTVLLSVAIITGILVAILLVLFNKFLYSKINKILHLPFGSQATLNKLRESIKNLHQEIHYFRHHKKVILNNLILSVFIQIINPLTFYIVSLSLGINIKVIYFFLFLPIIGAIALLPISLGGLGLRDATTILFFAKVGMSRDLAFAMSLTGFFFMLVYASIGGLIYVLTLRHRRLQYHKPHPISPKI